MKDFILEIGYKSDHIAVFWYGDTQFGGEELFCNAVNKLTKFYHSKWPGLKIEQSPRGDRKKKYTNGLKECYSMEKSLLERAKTLEPQNPNKSTGLFGGQSSGILNWNDIAYPHWYKMYKRLWGTTGKRMK